MPIRVLTLKNSLVSKERYRKIFDRTEKKIDLYGQICPDLQLKNFLDSKKISLEWCSHMTFGTQKNLQPYRWKHHGESADKFCEIFDDHLER